MQMKLEVYKRTKQHCKQTTEEGMETEHTHRVCVLHALHGKATKYSRIAIFKGASKLPKKISLSSLMSIKVFLRCQMCSSDVQHRRTSVAFKGCRRIHNKISVFSRRVEDNWTGRNTTRWSLSAHIKTLQD